MALRRKSVRSVTVAADRSNLRPGRRPPATLVRVSNSAALTIVEPARTVEVVHRVPVLVVGGGPSGLAAAIAAARAGAGVSLLERFVSEAHPGHARWSRVPALLRCLM